MAHSRKKTKSAARKGPKKAPKKARRPVAKRARPKVIARKKRHAGGRSIQGLLTLLGFNRGNPTQNIGVTAGAILAAVLVGYGVYQIRAPHSGTKYTAATSNTSARNAMDADFLAQMGKSRGERIAYWSGRLIDQHKAYKQLSKLTNGIKIEDNAPLVPDGFDCTTYVETVAALSQSDRSSDFVNKVMAIRYKGGEANYAHRNHFPEADWIPNNASAGILTDVTGEIASRASVPVKVETKQIQRHVWLEEQAKANNVTRAIASATQKQWPSTVNAQVSYIELSNLNKILSQIPNGTVINLVHRDAARKPVLISHQGFVVREGDKVLLRHASSGGDVKNVSLVDYLKNLTKGHEKKSWPLIGFNFDQIN